MGATRFSLLAAALLVAGTLPAESVLVPRLLNIGYAASVPGHSSSKGSPSYCIYLGGREDPDMGVQSAALTAILWLVHPAGTGKWYLACGGAGGCEAIDGPRPLLEEDAWRTVPAVAQHVLDALGTNDSDLVLVSCRPDTGDVYVYFDVRHQGDLRFYVRKLTVLRRYIEKHDMRTEISLETLRKVYTRP